MRARVAASLAIAGLVMIGSTVPSSALELGDDTDEPGSADAGVDGSAPSGTPVIRVDRPASPGRSDSSGGGITTANGYNCTWYRLDANGQPDFSRPYDPPPPDGTYAWLRCSGPQPIDDFRTRQSGGTVAAGAIERLPLPGPQVSANPSVDGDQVVGVPTWLWVSNWQPMSVSAFAAGTTADLVATPVSVSFDMGDGRAPLVMGVGPQFACQAPGVPYDVTRPSAEQHSDCTHTYERSSAGQPGQEFTVTATMSWKPTWTSDVGDFGELPILTRSSTFTLRVAEAQALVTG